MKTAALVGRSDARAAALDPPPKNPRDARSSLSRAISYGWGHKSREAWAFIRAFDMELGAIRERQKTRGTPDYSRTSVSPCDDSENLPYLKSAA